MILEASGIRIDVPSGWEAEIDGGAGAVEAGGEVPITPRVHVANFPLPPGRGDFGSGAVERMVPGDVLICLLEESGAAAGTATYAEQGMPRLVASDFSPNRMQRPIRGQAGAQKFFTVGRRAFVLYVVLGSYASRVSAVQEIEEVLVRITF